MYGWFSRKRVKEPMEFEVNISIKGEERGVKMKGYSYKKKGKNKKLEKRNERIGVKKEKVHTTGGKENGMKKKGKVLIK